MPIDVPKSAGAVDETASETASRPRSWLRAIALTVSAATGALFAYFFDPDRGRGRRAQTTDHAVRLLRRASRRMARGLRYTRSTAFGVGERLTRQHPASRDAPDDATLAQKVETQLFRDRAVPKGRMNVNAENGVVVLRGVADSRQQIERLVATTTSIEGVRAVRSLLRTPDQAPSDPFDQRRELARSGRRSGTDADQARDTGR